MTQYRYQIIFVSVTCLILAKLMPLWHIDSLNHYWDMDRAIALICFLLISHYYIEKLKSRSIAWLLIILFASLFLNHLWLNLSFERILQLLILTALVEEILLRAVLFELLLKKWRPFTILIITSLLFTLVHPAIYQNHLYGLMVLLSGLILGGSYLYFRKYSLQIAVITATGLHMAIILLGLGLNLIPR